MPKEPDDLVLECSGITLRFAAWNMHYGKGANAGVQVKVNSYTKENYNEQDPKNIFANNCKTTIELQRLIAGMTYKDLMDLSKWARTAATFLKRSEIKYRGKEDFEEEHFKNQLKKEEIK